MYDFYIDNDIINKSTYIYNIVPDVIGNCMRTVKPYTLTYMGCLDPVKGIVELLKIWLIVEKSVLRRNFISSVETCMIEKGKRVVGTILSILESGRLFQNIYWTKW